MLGGLLRVSAGEIWIDGTNIAALGEREPPLFRARTLGFIFQDFSLVAPLSARENVEVALNIAGETGRAARGRARRLLVGIGLDDRLEFPVEKLSGGREAARRHRAGDRQRARAHPCRRADRRPRLPSRRRDDATAAQLAKEEATTVMIVSHDERLRESPTGCSGSKTAASRHCRRSSAIRAAGC